MRWWMFQIVSVCFRAASLCRDMFSRCFRVDQDQSALMAGVLKDHGTHPQIALATNRIVKPKCVRECFETRNDKEAVEILFNFFPILVTMRGCYGKDIKIEIYIFPPFGWSFFGLIFIIFHLFLNFISFPDIFIAAAAVAETVGRKQDTYGPNFYEFQTQLAPLLLETTFHFLLFPHNVLNSYQTVAPCCEQNRIKPQRMTKLRNEITLAAGAVIEGREEEWSGGLHW